MSPEASGPLQTANPGRPSRRVLLGTAALLFAASALGTVFWCGSMSSMPGIPMPGGWRLSMTWIPGRAWPLAAAAFAGMWVVMMTAMMLPALVPMLLRCSEAMAATGETRPGRRIVLVGAGHGLVWAVSGAGVFAAGVMLAAALMRDPTLARAVPALAGAAVLAAAAVQFTPWKLRRLARFRDVHGRACATLAGPGAAWRHGLRLGMHCSACCANLMAVVLVIGAMDLRIMAFATAAIASERLAPSGERIARAIGLVVACAGIVLIAQATVPDWIRALSAYA